MAACFFSSKQCFAKPEEVKVGAYLENLRNFDYIGGTFRGDLYLWVDSPMHQPEPIDNIDYVRARATWSSPIIKRDEKKDRHYECRRYVVEVNHDWDIARFPFDTQRLKIKVEDLDLSAGELKFSVDSQSGFARNFIPAEWRVVSKKIYVSDEKYNTNFGEPSDGRDASVYSRFVIDVLLARHALPLFFKMVAGAYAAFAAICLSFWLTSDVPTYVSGRVGLIVGCLFGTIINQRVVEAVIGRSSCVTHIDLIHIVTLSCCILAGIITLFSTKLSADQRIKAARSLDKIAFWSLLIFYVLFNVVLVSWDIFSVVSLAEG